MNKKTTCYKSILQKKHSFLFQSAFAILCFLVFFSPGFSQEKKGTTTNTDLSGEKLLDQYINSLGTNVIQFDQSNIKQFWTDNSVAAQKDHFDILLQSSNKVFESIPLKVQLANVNNELDCKVTVICNKPKVSFKIYKNTTIPLSASMQEDNFVDYYVYSSQFHLEDTTDNYTFYLQFDSAKDDFISMKKILFQFSPNKDTVFEEWNHPIPEIDVNSVYKLIDFEQEGQAREIDLLKHKTGKETEEKRIIFLPSGWGRDYDSTNPNPLPIVTLSGISPLAGKQSLLLDASQTTQLAGVYSNTYPLKPHRFSFYVKGNTPQTRLQVQVRCYYGTERKYYTLKRMYFDILQDKTYHISWDIKQYPANGQHIALFFYASKGSVSIDQITMDND